MLRFPFSHADEIHLRLSDARDEEREWLPASRIDRLVEQVADSQRRLVDILGRRSKGQADTAGVALGSSFPGVGAP
jgi:predicted membrane chloride channel (bestrophin family)